MAEKLNRKPSGPPSQNRRTGLHRAKLIRNTQTKPFGNDVIVVNIPNFATRTEVVQTPRVLNLPVMPGREINIPVGGVKNSYFVYNVEVRNGLGSAWKLEKTYNDFRSLHSRIKAKFPVLGKVIKKFPKRTIFTLSHDSPRATHRMKFFQAYLQAMLQLKPRLMYLNDFLQLHKHTKAKQLKNIGLDDFEILKLLGKGSFGKVFLVRVIGSSDSYAMKVLKKEEVKKKRQVDHTKTELRVMGGAKHPFIVTLRHAFQTESRLFMVSDFCQGGELFFHLRLHGKFEPKVVQFYTAEIALALQYLHDRAIVYRDLKPENVLLDESGHIQITDFGLARDNVQGPHGAKTFCGTPEYLAPEMLIGRKQGIGYGFSVDWWGLGTLMHEMLLGLPPFYDKNRQKMLKLIVKGRLKLKGKDIPKESKSAIAGFLTKDPEGRLGVKGNGFEEIRSHPFYSQLFGGINFDDLLGKKIDPPFKPKLAMNLTQNFDDAFTQQPAKISEDEMATDEKDKNRKKRLATEEFDEEEEDAFADFNFTRQPMEEEFYSTKH